MRRALFAIVFSLLLVVAMPGSAVGDHANATASEHDTDTELSQGTLNNMQVSGTGTAAIVEIGAASSGFDDGFESDTADAGTPDNWEVTDGSAGWNVTTATSNSGSQSAAVDTGSGGGTQNSIRPSEQPVGASTDAIDVAMRFIDDDGDGFGATTVRVFESGTRVIIVGIRQGNIEHFDGSWKTLDSSADFEGEWVEFSITGIDPGSNTYDVSWTSAVGSGSQNNVGMENSMSSGWTYAKTAVHNGLGFVDDYAIAGGSANIGSYESATHAAEETVAGEVVVNNANNVSYDIVWEGDLTGDGTFETTLSSQTGLTTAGTKTATWSAFSGADVRVNVSWSKTGDNPTLDIDSDAVEWLPHAPTGNNATASPQGGETVNDEDVQVSIDVSDRDFSLAQGDTVTVTFYRDGFIYDSTDITSNQTVTTTITDLQAGTHTWRVTMADDNGHSVSSNTFSYEVVHKAAVADNGSATPDAVSQNSEDVSASIAISDHDFAETSGDTVRVDWYLDGINTTSEFISSNQTVSNVFAGLSSGDHTWHVEMEDEYGNTSTSAVFTVEVVHKKAEIDNASATPNGIDQNSKDVAASVPVSDHDFAVAEDTVRIDWYLDGVNTTSEFISTNQTVSNTFTGLSEGSHTWHIETEDKYGNMTTSDTFTVTVVHKAPVIDNGSATPTGDQSTKPGSLQIDVTDHDFAVNEESVDVEFFHNGGSIGTDTLSANGTASITVNAVGGSNSWYAVATDQYGNVTTSQTFTYNVPENVTIRNESRPHEILTNVNVTIEFYFDRDGAPDLVVERNTTDGAINMTGLPVDEPFVVEAESDGWYNRRIYVQSLFESQTIYLLNTTVEAVQPTYVIRDYSGQFPQDVTVMQIQKGINESWQTVEGDFFGASGSFSAQLEYNQRHRLVLINTVTGEERQIGTHIPVSSTDVVIEVFPDDTIVAPATDVYVNFDPEVGPLDANVTTFNVSINNNTIEVKDYNITVLVDGQKTQKLTGTKAETRSITEDLSNANNVTLWVNWTDTNNDLTTQNMSYVVREPFSNKNALLPILTNMFVDVKYPSQAALFFAFIIITFAVIYIGGQGSTEAAGAAGIIGGVIMLAIGWLPVELLSLLAIVYLGILAVIYR